MTLQPQSWRFFVSFLLLVLAAAACTLFLFVIDDRDTFSGFPRPAVMLETGPLPDDGELSAAVTNETISGSKPSRKIILLWGRYFGRNWPWFPTELTCSGMYSCSFTTNTSEYVNSAAVLYHGRSEVKGLAPLNERPRGQIWIYYNQEAPPEMGSFSDIPYTINWTLTYIRSADVHHYYGEVVPGKFQGGFDLTKNYLEGKNKTAAAMISNCRGYRMEYISKLSQYIDIDVYGGCGGKKACRDCWDIFKPYKFYLAFENAYCKEYVTEKFYFNALSHGMIPVTINGADLTDPKIAPPGSYIDATKFSSAKQLADFLRTEGSDPEHYNKYFRWHSTHNVVYPSYYCELCEAVHHAEKKKNIYKDVAAWYRKAGECSTYPSIS